MTDFNANWQFKKEGGEFKTVTLPHDAMLEETRSADAKSGSAQAYFPSGRYIYEKHFSLTDEQANKHITFVFGSVYKNAKVFINGTLAKGAAPYGYITFAICADGLVNAGDNIIRVETDNSAQPDSRWYSGAGIYRSVNMYMQEQERILLAHDYNHPSVIMFSIGNEVSEPAEEKGLALAKEMTGLLHTLDDSRAVCGGFNLMIITKAAKGKGVYKEDGGRDESGDKMSGMNSAMFNMIAGMVGTGMNKASNGSKADKIISPLLDTVEIAGYNYASGRYAEDARLHPERVIMGSETFPQDLAKNWETVKKQPSLIGDFMWTAWDYLGETGIGTWSYEKDAKGFDKSYPWLLADTGAYDILSDPTGEALWTKAVWGKESDVFLAVRPCNGKGRRLIKSTWRGTNAIPSWSWSGCEGEQAVVEVFSRANVVGLYLNGELIGRKRTKNCRAVFKLRFKPGKLTAVAYDSKKRIAGKTSLITAGEAGINVSPEKTTAAVGEIIYVDISIADSKGIVESTKDTKLSVTVENGELIGFGSAAPRTEERFDLGEYTTWHGRAQAVVRASSSGVLTVLAAGQGYKAAKAEITVE